METRWRIGLLLTPLRLDVLTVIGGARLTTSMKMGFALSVRKSGSES